MQLSPSHFLSMKSTLLSSPTLMASMRKSFQNITAWSSGTTVLSNTWGFHILVHPVCMPVLDILTCDHHVQRVTEGLNTQSGRDRKHRNICRKTTSSQGQLLTNLSSTCGFISLGMVHSNRRFGVLGCGHQGTPSFCPQRGQISSIKQCFI